MKKCARIMTKLKSRLRKKRKLIEDQGHFTSRRNRGDIVHSCDSKYEDKFDCNKRRKLCLANTRKDEVALIIARDRQYQREKGKERTEKKEKREKERKRQRYYQRKDQEGIFMLLQQQSIFSSPKDETSQK